MACDTRRTGLDVLIFACCLPREMSQGRFKGTGSGPAGLRATETGRTDDLRSRECFPLPPGRRLRPGRPSRRQQASTITPDMGVRLARTWPKACEVLPTHGRETEGQRCDRSECLIPHPPASPPFRVQRLLSIIPPPIEGRRRTSREAGTGWNSSRSRSDGTPRLGRRGSGNGGFPW